MGCNSSTLNDGVNTHVIMNNIYICIYYFTKMNYSFLIYIIIIGRNSKYLIITINIYLTIILKKKKIK